MNRRDEDQKRGWRGTPWDPGTIREIISHGAKNTSRAMNSGRPERVNALGAMSKIFGLSSGGDPQSRLEFLYEAVKGMFPLLDQKGGEGWKDPVSTITAHIFPSSLDPDFTHEVHEVMALFLGIPFYSREGESLVLHIPEEVNLKLGGAPEEKRQKLIQKIQGGHRFREVLIPKDEPLEVVDAKTGEQRTTWGSLIVRYPPPILEEDDQGQPVLLIRIRLELDFKGLKPARWTEESRGQVKERILASLRSKLIQPPLDFPEVPETKGWQIERGAPEAPPPVLVRTSKHLQEQFIMKTPPPGRSQLSLLELEDVRREAEGLEISIIGIELTHSRQQAIFALQRLLDRTQYQGNLPGEYYDGTGPLRFKGTIPAIEFTLAEYTEAYGASKYQTARGKMEFSGKERQEALQALRDLALGRFILVYKRRYWENGREYVDRVETVAQLVEITQGWKALTGEEDALMDAGLSTEEIDEKMTKIVAIPHPIFVDQLDRHFILKPANYLQEIKIKHPKASKYARRFIEYLYLEASNRRGGKGGWTIEINYIRLAEKLGMGKRIEQRAWKEIRRTLNKCYEIAKDLGYILDYKTVPGSTVEEKEVIVLNPARFTGKQAVEGVAEDAAQKALPG